MPSAGIGTCARGSPFVTRAQEAALATAASPPAHTARARTFSYASTRILSCCRCELRVLVRAPGAQFRKRFELLDARHERERRPAGTRRAPGDDGAAIMVELTKREKPATSRSELARAAGLCAQDRLVIPNRGIAYVLKRLSSV